MSHEDEPKSLHKRIKRSQLALQYDVSHYWRLGLLALMHPDDPTCVNVSDDDLVEALLEIDGFDGRVRKLIATRDSLNSLDLAPDDRE